MNGGFNRLETMAQFFNERAEGYEEHMRQILPFDEFYGAIATLIPTTESELAILDLGCGTGLELAPILAKAPRARITGIDLATAMIARLREHYRAFLEQLHIIQGSYLEYAFPESYFDYIVAVQTLHHLLPGTKVELYRKIRRSLKPGGRYIEGDFVTTPELETEYLMKYRAKLAVLGPTAEGEYHIDSPFTVTTQESLLAQAGFEGCELVYQSDNCAVLAARPY